MARASVKLTPEELALLEVMANYDLKPGQMLLLGPQSVALLTGRDTGFRGKLPDKYVLEREDWE